MIEVHHVHDLEARLIHFVVRIEVGVSRQARCSYFFNDGGMGIAATFGIGIDIDLELAHPARELISERRMSVVELAHCLGVHLLDQLALAGRKASVIAVVRPNHLDLIDVDEFVLLSGTDLRCGADGQRKKE